MTTITIDRAVVEQALEALSLALSDVNWRADSPTQPVIHKAHVALRAALAQQAEPLNLADPAVQKRLASQWGYVPAAAQAEPAQEPVAYFGSAYVNENGVHITTVLGPVAIPQDAKLYTAPPQRKPLTEEEIESCRQKGYAHAGLSAPFDFGKAARAVERAVWEKNHG